MTLTEHKAATWVYISTLPNNYSITKHIWVVLLLINLTNFT